MPIHWLSSYVLLTVDWQLFPFDANQSSTLPWGTEREYFHVLKSMGMIPGLVLPDPLIRALIGVDGGFSVSIWAMSFLARSMSAL